MGKGVRSLRLLTFFSSGRLARLASLGSLGVRYNMHGQYDMHGRNFSSGTAYFLKFGTYGGLSV